ncbi:MAG: alcohol dehydrogenase catalytic domain-containing protein [Armatimonadetes bacterium]|nr:alcohol dehydrogenase catalytic domain-containing protein [Armatimonadota bacterium]
MRAAFFNGKGQLRVDEVPATAPGPGEVAVRVSACGVCGSDLHSFLGHWPQPPFAPGHEIAGTVEAVGEGVTHFAPGDAVTIEPLIPCGECRPCRAGQPSACGHHEFISWHRHGGFADQVVAPARCLLALPEGPARAQGALVEPLAVAIHGLRRAPLQGGDTLLVLGAGTIGLLAIAAGRALGAGRILATAKHTHQAERAEQMGADTVVRMGEGNPAEALATLTQGEGVDVVLDSAGGSQAIDLALRAARRGGTLALVGAYPLPPRTALNEVIGKELRLVGSNCYGLVDGRRDFALAIDLLASGRVDPSPLVTHRFPLAEIQQAFETASNKSTGAVKVLVEP